MAMMRKYQEYPQRAKETTFLLLSTIVLIIHILTFQILKVSPSSLLENNTFWFFISNVLILIIAADYGVFSSSKRCDLYDEYVHVMPRQSRACVVEPLKEDVEKNNEEEIKEIVVWTEPKKKKENGNDRVEVEKGKKDIVEEEEDEDEYAKMSNEEVNRRVEEFIRKFNTQIRLERAAVTFR